MSLLFMELTLSVGTIQSSVENFRPKSNKTVVYKPNPSREGQLKEWMEMTGSGTTEHVAWRIDFEGAA